MFAPNLSEIRVAELPIAFLRECFDYCPESGALTWRDRPETHFPTADGHRQFNANRAGKRVGRLDHGYLRFGVSYKGLPYTLYVHRVAFALTNGKYPETVDHIDGNRANNCISNLRAASRQDNNRNVGVRPHSKLGVKGVRSRTAGRYDARMTVNGKSIWIGQFKTVEEAADAYKRAALKVHGEFAHRSVKEAM